MSRFVRKGENEVLYSPNGYQCLEKLYALEDIEEELEMDLITLFEIYNKLCEQKFVYVKFGNEIIYSYDDYFVIDFKDKEIIGMEYEPIDYYSFKDYGKTWALTREVLENEKIN